MFTIADKLGLGVYSPAEAAFYASVSPRLMTRWVFGDASGKPVIERQLRNPSEKVVTFLDLVQILAVREVRLRANVSLQKIRQGVDEARQRYGVDEPLARQHKIFIVADGKSRGRGQIVIRRPDDDLDVRQYAQSMGGKPRNIGREVDQGIHLADKINGASVKTIHMTGIPGYSMDDQYKHHKIEGVSVTPVAEPFLDDLRFDRMTGLASEYCPMSEGIARIVLNPHRRFGEPIVEPGGYTAETLWDGTTIEGGIEAAAEAYGVTVAEVRLANAYFDSLQNRPA